MAIKLLDFLKSVPRNRTYGVFQKTPKVLVKKYLNTPRSAYFSLYAFCSSVLLYLTYIDLITLLKQRITQLEDGERKEPMVVNAD